MTTLPIHGTRATLGSLLAVGLLLGLLPPAATARGLGFGLFGCRESIHEIAPLSLKGPRGERLVLAHKISTYMFVAGVGLTDDGYVLGIRGNSDRYYAMPRDIAEYQRRGLLPSPLPRYRIPFHKFLFGFSLWWILAAGPLAKVFRYHFKEMIPGWRRRDRYVTGGPG